ncbi:MAG: S9 family peptidase [Patiriisocius sp.]|uniref:S9 family peptidase n=1 Tax=Patiriisocius sp. TaxID=2822396 RepID=UPI003EF74BE1
MKQSILSALVFLFLVTFSTLTAQNKDITVEDIYGGTFRADRLDVLRSLENGKEYAVLNYSRQDAASTVDVYDYKSGEKVRTLVSSKDLDGIDYIISYDFNSDESKLILATQLDQVYRRSALGTYYIYDIKSKKLSKISEDKIQEPILNNAGTEVAYGFENNIYIKNLNSGRVTQVTNDGLKNSVINGITDWVYEEEFAFVRAFDWSADGKHIGYIKFDESEVPRFSMDVYGKELYPNPQVFKYPKAGEPNAKVSLHIYHVDAGSTKDIDLSKYNSYYIPRLEWTKDKNVLSAQLTNRKQNVVDLVFVDAKTGNTSLVRQEKDDAYVDITDDLTFFDDNSFIWTSERDGWNHIYYFDKNGKQKYQVTKGNWEVTSYYGYDEKTNKIFYQSTENGSINRDVYSISLDGTNKKRLSTGTGTNGADFSADYSCFINSFHNTTTPYTFTLNDSKTGNVVREIINNAALKAKTEEYKMSPKVFSTINVNGYDLNMYTIKPLDFDPNKVYPLFMYQYSGPGSQNVANKWDTSNDYWHQMLAQQGYIIVCVDGRGTGLKGRDFKKMTQKELGKLEVEDQIAVAQKLGQEPYIDANRIGIWGWSYGGFMSSNCLFQGADTFSMAIAVAPVTSWRYYDTIYTERYMTTPQENASGYDNNSPISHVDKLEGKFLLVHGSADDNVHVQNSMQLVEALIQAKKQFDWRMYPDKNHGIYGGYTRIHLYNMMTDFIKNNL